MVNDTIVLLKEDDNWIVMCMIKVCLLNMFFSDNYFLCKLLLPAFNTPDSKMFYVYRTSN